MIGLLCFVLTVLASPFKSKLRLEAENAVLRHQLIVLKRRLHGRVRLTNNDRWFFIQLYRWFPSILKVLTIIRPETLVRWHRAGFRCYWRWKSRPQGGRPQIDTELRVLIRRMSVENPLWGAPRIHGELLKLGFEVAQSSVAKYMVKRRGPPSQGWRTFLRNHAPDIAAMDLFVVPTIGFDLLYAHRPARPQRPCLDQRHNKSDGRMGCTPNNGGISLERGSALHDPGPGSHLWCRRHTPTARHGHPGQAYRTGLTLAEWLCRTVDRIDPARVSRSCHHPGRSAFASDSAILRKLLQQHENPSLLEQGCSYLASYSANRNHLVTSDPRRASPSLRPGLGFRYTQGPSPANSTMRTPFSGPMICQSRAGRRAAP